jgi:hypothetical protein
MRHVASTRAAVEPARARPLVVRLLVKGAERANGWLRAHSLMRMTPEDRLISLSRAVGWLRRADRMTKYKLELCRTAHLRAICELYEQGAFDGARLAAEDVIDDCRELGFPQCVAAWRAHGERARSLRRVGRLSDAVQEFELVIGAALSTTATSTKWMLSYRLDLALTCRDFGNVERSTEELRALVPDMVTEFGQDSAWMVATVTQLATNVASSGDYATAIDMAASLLPVSTRLRGPLSREALTLRSKIARWTIVDGSGDQGRQAAARALIDFTRAGLSTSAEACELRYDYAESLFDSGEVDYAIAQLSSLREDLASTLWATSSFAESVREDLDAWRESHPGGASSQS